MYNSSNSLLHTTAPHITTIKKYGHIQHQSSAAPRLSISRADASWPKLHLFRVHSSPRIHYRLFSCGISQIIWLWWNPPRTAICVPIKRAPAGGNTTGGVHSCYLPLGENPRSEHRGTRAAIKFHMLTLYNKHHTRD